MEGTYGLKLELFPLKHTLVLQWNEKKLVLFEIRASVELNITDFVTVKKGYSNLFYVKKSLFSFDLPLFLFI